ncbi:MAG: hypothetical protein PHG20_03950, partial [Geobacteraceae bacterium]|nr:hypothetical protein [Geobacteraceae bacterium]
RANEEETKARIAADQSAAVLQAKLDAALAQVEEGKKREERLLAEVEKERRSAEQAWAEIKEQYKAQGATR